MRRGVLGAGLVALVAAGCGGGPVPAAGVVTLDGVPVPNAGLLFHPDGGPPDRRPVPAVAGPDGRFAVTAASKPGLVAGAYKVTVVTSGGGVGDAAGPVAIGSPEYAKAMTAGRAADAPKSRVPAKYSSPKETPLLVVIPAGGGSDVNLALSSK